MTEITDDIVDRLHNELARTGGIYGDKHRAPQAALMHVLNPPPEPEIVVTDGMFCAGHLAETGFPWKREPRPRLEAIYRAMKRLDPK